MWFHLLNYKGNTCLHCVCIRLWSIEELEALSVSLERNISTKRQCMLRQTVWLRRIFDRWNCKCTFAAGMSATRGAAVSLNLGQSQNGWGNELRCGIQSCTARSGVHVCGTFSGFQFLLCETSGGVPMFIAKFCVKWKTRLSQMEIYFLSNWNWICGREIYWDESISGDHDRLRRRKHCSGSACGRSLRS